MTKRDQRQAKCERILANIINRCNQSGTKEENVDKPAVSFGPDCWGENSLTIWQADGSHSHVGVGPESTFDDLVNQIHGLLIDGRGLSFEGGKGE